LFVGCTTLAKLGLSLYDERAATNLNSLSLIIKNNMNDAEPYNMRGVAFAKIDMHSEAISDFETAIRIDPNFYQAYNNRGLVYQRMGLTRLALNDFSKAIDILNSYYTPYINRARLWQQIGDHDNDSIHDLDTAIELDHNNSIAYFERGLIAQKHRKHGAAIAYFSESIEHDLTNAAVFNRRGLSYMALGSIVRAAVDFSKAIELKKNDASSWLHHGIAHRSLGLKSIAHKSCSKALSLGLPGALQERLAQDCMRTSHKLQQLQPHDAPNK